MLLEHATWPEVETYLQGSQAVILPIGATEQHGPSGLIGTDAICAEVVARAVGEQAGALVAPTLAVGMSMHHLGFPGSMSLRPSTLMAVVRDHVLSLARHGFTRFLWVNGHGGNIATLEAAFPEIYAEARAAGLPHAAQLRCGVANWFDGSRIEALSEELYGDKEGWHGTPSELALSWFAFPDEQREVDLPEPAPVGATIYTAEDYREQFPDGRIGSHPELIEPGHGRRIFEAGVADVLEAWREFAKD